MSEMILTLGLAPDGTPVRFDLARLAHLFIGGVAGSGKTYCIESLLAQLPENVQTVRIDTSDEEAALAYQVEVEKDYGHFPEKQDQSNI